MRLFTLRLINLRGRKMNKGTSSFVIIRPEPEPKTTFRCLTWLGPELSPVHSPHAFPCCSAALHNHETFIISLFNVDADIRPVHTS